MILLRLAPVLLALVVLGAHGYRSGMVAAVVVVVVLIALLWVRRPWSARAIQIGLAFGTLEWLRTAAALMAYRQSLGAPYVRLAVILGTVAMLTAGCLAVFRSAAVRDYFRLSRRTTAVSPAAKATSDSG